GQRVTELMKQVQYSPFTVAQMAVTLFSASKGYLDDVDVAKIVDFENAMQDYMKANSMDLLNKINESGDYNDNIEAQLHEAIKSFKSNSTW
ncbi:MAG: F0F1 ATP synthase subunit alpha, partial [Thiotrichaceae bacterium]|nr:F0F1 ATP synthase subunit alpha [Thiotrichaceae bacterium]